MDNLKWGFIGCGNVVETKSGPAFNTAENSEIYAVMGRNIDNAKASAQKLGEEKWYDNADDVVNAVYIATPPGLHLEQAIKRCKGKKQHILKSLLQGTMKRPWKLLRCLRRPMFHCI